ncbi:alpha/beta fold hydrolase [Tabrizicola sp.]|uniref:alpha/beta fold hydrolase n=1 Tax=Tabrizicola sp. TaxID=2005166 RepID=UPI001A60102C|nr:alpha/beta fold hydrolase [Tabrizicola sp.]MBL9074686.1 alpha/beta fold hydrolase [Tabrizicola sp.]
MGREVVQVRGLVPLAPEAVWSVVRDFCGAWHPWVETIREEQGEQGALVRAFTVQGEDTRYREQLTYLSDSDRVLGYTHLEGIKDCEAYDARITVTPAEAGGSVVGWTATVRAPASRLTAICEGTKAVFEAGIAALAAATEQASATPRPSPPVSFETLIFDDLPRLALSVTPGIGDDRLCLFLHGIGGGRTNWTPQVQAVGATMRAAALDLRGYGDSTLGPRQSTVDDYCADILRVAEKLGARRLVLVGLSYGSWIATSFAMRHPEMLDGLVLSGGCTGMSEAGPDEREAFRVSREVPMDAGQVPADFAPAVVKVLAGPDASEDTRQRLFDSMAAIPAATYRDALNCFTNPLERFDFAKLTMPVLLMTGEHDRLAPPAEIRGIAGRIWDAAPRPDVRFEVIAGAGHVCNVEQPDLYNRHLSTFLNRLT